MSSLKTPEPLKLENSALWKEVNSLVEHLYGRLSALPEDEKWNSVYKIRTASTDLVFYVGMALGNGAPMGGEYEWGNARKHAAALKTIYRHVGRLKLMELDPDVMVRLDKIIKQIDEELAVAYKRIDAVNDAELKPWLEKYRIWQEMNKERN
ncbi:MAG TPA: hypothetical protein VLH84_03745 [Patescibacteria group bacterium]|nr:hypothetical protein [Patescibacteria group bacterium]